MTKVLVAGALSAVFACVAYAQQPMTVEVELVDTESLLIGTATFTQGPKDVTIALNLKDLPPGEHALHLHTTPECKGFSLQSAGGHFNPSKKMHGLKNPEGPHAGDLGNFTVEANGTAKATLTAPDITLAADAPNSVFANGGTALIIHDGRDDMMTDPEGGAGGRLACAAIIKTK